MNKITIKGDDWYIVTQMNPETAYHEVMDLINELDPDLKQVIEGLYIRQASLDTLARELNLESIDQINNRKEKALQDLSDKMSDGEVLISLNMVDSLLEETANYMNELFDQQLPDEINDLVRKKLEASGIRFADDRNKTSTINTSESVDKAVFGIKEWIDRMIDSFQKDFELSVAGMRNQVSKKSDYKQALLDGHPLVVHSSDLVFKVTLDKEELRWEEVIARHRPINDFSIIIRSGGQTIREIRSKNGKVNLEPSEFTDLQKERGSIAIVLLIGNESKFEIHV